MNSEPVIDVGLVERLVAAQFPEYADLSIEAVQPGGWDNRTFRLGDEMSVRLPSAERYADKVEKEQRWLPKLAPLLPLPIPEPLALGAPGDGYPWPWSINRWLPGEDAAHGRIGDLEELARTLAAFVRALHRVDSADGPPPGPHNFLRGSHPSVYDAETREAMEVLQADIDTDAVAEVWDRALESAWSHEPVWLHGDLAPGNLLVDDGRLSAVIDFGGCGVGDPACDLSIAWTLLSGKSREAFHEGLPLDEETWARGRGWTLWKALKTVIEKRDPSPAEADAARLVIDAIIAEHRGDSSY